ncbi:transglycosylase domain-containing protein [Enterovirga rhinocerotis]|uniref:Penicillin-binding protein 1A n=1 Tax=Enterovirga rhinocerotis TaxID=1339210 RepID=A0A4R7C4P0_9HYPH|nr:PBP1A family penicillin-binding protein [Enterovirga rhinocerotis]TDR93131.1 penicillin-binding protein 1A [Enterovirga rhinocerotis]
MADRRRARRDRREPSFGPSANDLALSREDRAGGARRRPVKSASRKRKRRSGRSFLGRLVYGCVVLCLWGGIALAALVAYHATQLPPIDQLSVPKRPPNIAIVAADGTLIANRGETGGRAVPLKELPPYLPRAFIAIEDRRFHSHLGIDPFGIARAVVNNLTGRGGMQGGSTLTQQLAKNLFLTQERTASRKIQEAILALWLEHRYSKDQILELYLNRVYFGAGAYGVEAAAQRYFGKPARGVSIAEAATLAGLVQAPSRLAPTRNPDAARARAALVLAAMVEEGFIKPADQRAALGDPAKTARRAGAGSANYAADLVMDVLDDFVGEIEDDITVVTTIQPALQNAAEKALVQELDQKGAKFNVEQGALVAMRPDGAVRAVVGGRNYTESQFNRATTAKRQPGSSFKPFVYLAALERGLTPDDVRQDAPISIRGWSPENYTRDYRGPVTLRDALAQSLNTVAVRLCQEVGPKAVVAVAQRLGIVSSLKPNVSIALGTSEVSPIEMVGAFAAFANGGTGVIPYVILEVKGARGKVIYRRKDGGLGRVVAPAVAGMMNAMMRETLVSGTARKAEIPGWEAAGKTGTSQDFRDAWFVGYTSTLVAGIWLGNDDGSAMRKVTGGNLPAEIWHRFMTTALAGQEPRPLPGLGGWRGTRSSPAPSPQATTAPPTRTGSVRPRPEGPVDGIGGLLEKLFGG